MTNGPISSDSNVYERVQAIASNVRALEGLLAELQSASKHLTALESELTAAIASAHSQIQLSNERQAELQSVVDTARAEMAAVESRRVDVETAISQVHGEMDRLASAFEEQKRDASTALDAGLLQLRQESDSWQRTFADRQARQLESVDQRLGEHEQELRILRDGLDRRLRSLLVAGAAIAGVLALLVIIALLA